MVIADVPPLAFVIDTDTYAGNFERHLVAYMTGCVGECGVGQECAEQYHREVADVQAGVDEDLVMHVADENGCHRPASIYSNPDWWNDGVGNHYEHAKRPAPAQHWPASGVLLGRGLASRAPVGRSSGALALAREGVRAISAGLRVRQVRPKAHNHGRATDGAPSGIDRHPGPQILPARRLAGRLTSDRRRLPPTAAYDTLAGSP